MSSDNFLSRWSRRKQAIRRNELPPEDEAAPPARSEASEAASAAAAPPESTGRTAQAETAPETEEIAALPSVEELTAETDISGFLRKDIPEALRKAALRRAWSLDPKIRDFVGDARDYAWDWNTPGGVPGSGALPAGDEIARMVARIVGGETSNADALGGPADPDAAVGSSKVREQHSMSDADAGGAGVAVSEENPASATYEEAPPSAADRVSAPVPLSFPEDTQLRRTSAADGQADGEERPEPLSARRHGGALPL